MARRKKTGDDGLSGEDAAIWRVATGDVRRMPGKGYSMPRRENDAPAKPKIRETVAPGKAARAAPVPAGRELDRRSDERLRKGQMKIEARLDLHGMTQAEAHEALLGFISRGYRAGRRCVLVITGKGSRSKEEGGILRRRVPQWLAAAPLEPMILKTYPARQKDGGEGALYVLLRRNRDN